MRQRERTDKRKKQIGVSFPVIDNAFCHDIVIIVCESTPQPLLQCYDEIHDQ